MYRDRRWHGGLQVHLERELLSRSQLVTEPTVLCRYLAPLNRPDLGANTRNLLCGIPSFLTRDELAQLVVLHASTRLIGGLKNTA